MNITKYFTVITIATIIMVFGMSCRKQYAATEVHMADYGWVLYEKAVGKSDFRSSNLWFYDSMNEDTTYMDAYNGLGWTYGQLTQLDSSIFYFMKGLNFTENAYDTSNVRNQIWAGLCFAYNAQGNDTLSILFGDSLIENLSSGLLAIKWTFPHNHINKNSKIDDLDVHVTLSASNFAISQFDQSVLHIQSILDGLNNPTIFSPDINTVVGRAELALWIDSLSTILSTR